MSHRRSESLASYSRLLILLSCARMSLFSPLPPLLLPPPLPPFLLPALLRRWGPRRRPGFSSPLSASVEAGLSVLAGAAGAAFSCYRCPAWCWVTVAEWGTRNEVEAKEEDEEKLVSRRGALSLLSAASRGFALHFCLACVALPACTWRIGVRVRLGSRQDMRGKKNEGGVHR